MPRITASIGVIGGSGLYALDDLKVIAEVKPKTPWGDPSDAIVVGEVGGHRVAFLPRHGRGHRITPTEVNARANIAALKSIGVEKIVSFSAVGSLKQELKPLDFVVPSQLIDRTRLRPNTYFGDGCVAHVGFADPFSVPLSNLLYEKARGLGLTVHRDETLVCMEGPMFSTRAESHLYRSWGAGLINMSALPESKLAREAEISYGLVCMVTDYDCWHESEEAVDIQMVIANLTKNAENAKALLRASLDDVARLDDTSGVKTATQFAIITAKELIPKQTVAKLRYLFPNYFPAAPRKNSSKSKPSKPSKASKASKTGKSSGPSKNSKASASKKAPSRSKRR
jgi:5'-methylthioadenosine phosphorylase